MNQQEMEVELQVLKERINLHAHRIQDVDECCGKLKGVTEAENKILSEKIVKLEEHMDVNCISVEQKVEVLEERVNNSKELIQEINSNLTKIRYLIYAALITSLASIIWK